MAGGPVILYGKKGAGCSLNTVKGFHAFLWWFFHLARFYFSTTPLGLTVGVLSLTFSKVFQVLAFFIPLKLFIIMSSDKMPHYMRFLADTFSLGRGDLIFLLSCSVGIFYLSYIALGIVYRRIVDGHFEKLELAGLTLGGIELSKRDLIKMHGRCIAAVADLFLIGFAMAMVFLVNGAMALVWIFLMYFNFIFFFRNVFLNCKENRVSFLKLKHNQFIEYFSSANFLVIFGLLVVQASYMDLGLFSAIFLLLLSRMLFRALSGFSVNSLNIYKVIV